MKMHPYYFTYIVCCADGTYYIGSTSDLATCLKQHNGLLGGGARYTRNRRPVEIKYYEQYEKKGDALRREYALKKLTHAQKEILCNA